MRARHGQAATNLYRVWVCMRSRCTTPSCSNYERYGGSGVTVCAEWNDFTPFYEWSLANGYQPGLVIDRRDSTQGYSPDNCRWVTRAENNANRTGWGRSKFKGVTKNANRWVARIAANGINVYIGRFKTELEAALAYDAAAHRLHGEFSRLNFPERIYGETWRHVREAAVWQVKQGSNA